ncbi:hypothetical protein GF324_12830 [bacterium]|nr:hypothetical protein [bacterium]
MPVGRVVSASLDESKSAIVFNFEVLQSKPGEYYVLDTWGAFVVSAPGANKTRLIVRTHGGSVTSWVDRIAENIGMTGHYVMERRVC